MPSNNPASTTVTQHASNSSAPYVGPRPFTQGDRDIFFGRTQEAIELTSLVKAHPEVVLYAQSGAGKSSLLFAQVMPTLDIEEEFDVLPVGRVRSQESSVIPDQKINNIYMFNALKDLSCDQLNVMERAQLTLADYLKRRPRPPVPSKEAEDGHKTDSPENQEKRLARVITFDQFEEIFTLYPERYKDRQDFFCQVADALKADPFLRVIFSMREDYIAEVEPFIHVLPQNLRTKYRLERLRKTNALSAVKKPLQTDRVNKLGRHFVDGAAESLVDRLMLIKVRTASGEKIEEPGEFVDPVQLQVVCQTLWEKLPPEKTAITKADIDQYANVDEALSDFYESCVRKAIAAVNKGEEQSDSATITEGQLRGWFEQKLITREGKRNMVFRERDMVAGMRKDVVDELENSHIVRIEMRGGEPWYELSHDRFIPPIKESNRRFLLKQPVAKRKAQELEARAAEWKAKQRNNALLLNRGELVDAQNWMRNDAAAIGYSETLFAFLQAAEAAIEHEDNKQQQLLAEAQQRQMLSERQRSRQLRLGFVVTSVLLIFAISSAVFAINRWRTADSAQHDAKKAHGEAKTAEAKATDNYNRAQTALTQSQIAEQKAVEAARELQFAIARESKEKKKAQEAQAFADKQKALAEKAQADTLIALQATKTAQAETEFRNRQIEDILLPKLEESQNRAWSLKLAANANSVMLENPELALRLALEAAARKETEPAKTALGRAYLKFRMRRILNGHRDIVWKAVYGPGGQIFSISEDGTLRIWDPLSAKEPRIIPATAPIHAFAVTPNGGWLATEEANSKGTIWNLRDGTTLELLDLSGPIAALALSPDATLLATEATATGEIATRGRDRAGATPRIWEVSSGKMLAELKGHSRAVSAIVFSPKGDLVATASWDSTARLWDAKTGREVAVLKGHTDPLTSVAFDGTGKLLVTSSYDRTARVWEVASGKEKWVLRGHTGVVQSAVFSLDNRKIVTAGRDLSNKLKSGSNNLVPLSTETARMIGTVDNTARIWNVESGVGIGTLVGHKAGINSALFSSDGKYIVTASDDYTAIVWNAVTREPIAPLQGHDGAVNSAVFGSDNASVLTASSDGTLQVWNWRNTGQIRFSADQRNIISLDPTNNDSIVTGSVDGMVRFWDLKGVPRDEEIKLALPPEWAQEEGRLVDIAVSPKAALVVTSSVASIRGTPSNDTKAHVWNVKKREFEHALKHSEAVTKVLFSRTGRYLATMSEKQAQVWKTSDFTKPIQLFDVPPKTRMLTVAFTTGEESFLVARDNGLLSIFNLETKTTDDVPLGNNILRAAFSADGNMIVVNSEKGVVVWTVATYPEKVSTLRRYVGASKLAFSADDKLILTADLNAKIRVWNMASGELVQEFDRLDESITTLNFANDNRSIIAGGLRGGIYVVDCDLCQPFKEVVKMACKKNPRELTAEEIQEYMPEEKDSQAGRKPCANQ